MNWHGGIIQGGSRREPALASTELSGDVLSRLMPAATKMKGLIKIALPLAILALFLFGQALNFYCNIFHKFEAILLSVQWMLLVCLAVWCGTFIFLTFGLKDLPLVGLLLIAMAVYFIGYTASSRAADAIILSAGVTLGKGTQFLLKNEKQKVESRNILIGLIGLLAFSAWWHLDMINNFYLGPRWTGLWDNPNTYGMLMGAGVVVTAGLLADRRWKMVEKEKRNPPSRCFGVARAESGKLFLRLLRYFAAIKSAICNRQSAMLLIAAGMMAVGLLFSYSRGAWLATTIGLLYLAWSYGRLKWRWVLPGILVVAAVVCVFWHATADNGPWYLKRLDFSRPSAQHRVSAWRGALQMMRDHPLGVGWNQAVSIYGKNYSPPVGGAAALTMNSYLMLGTELGLPGLLCFVAYVGLALKAESRKQKAENQNAKTGDSHGPVLTQPSSIFHPPSSNSLAVACRAGALVLLVAFWFDGGLFDLPTAAVFWVLLELGAEVGTSRCDVRTAQRTVPTNNDGCGALKS